MTAALQTSGNLMTQDHVPRSDSGRPRRRHRAPGAERAGRFSSLVILACALGITQDSALARPKHVELQWGDLTPLIVDKKVTLQLPEDVTVKGRVLSVRDDGLYMNIKKRSKKKAYPKGPTVIPRADVSLIEVRQKHGVKVPSDTHVGRRRRRRRSHYCRDDCRWRRRRRREPVGGRRAIRSRGWRARLWDRRRGGHQGHAH